MKVLVISAWKPRKGGIVTHVENLIEQSKNDFLILTYGDGREKDEKQVLRAPYINLPLLRGLTFAFSAVLKSRNEDFDIIHAHYAIPQGFAGVLLKCIRKKPLVLTVHGSDITVLGESHFIRWVLKWVIRHSDKILAVSTYLKDLLLGLGADEGKIKVIYNGVKSKKAAEGKELRVVYIGALVKQKGVDILIEAFREVVNRFDGVKLLIVGDGPERGWLEGLSKDIGLVNVKFTGYLENLDNIFTKTSVFVLPSRKEGFGIAVLEAMARGVPVVASKTGGIIEVVKHEKNGLLFKSGDYKDLADSIVRVLGDGKLRSRLVENGNRTAKSFTWDRMGEEVDNVYKAVV